MARRKTPQRIMDAFESMQEEIDRKGPLVSLDGVSAGGVVIPATEVIELIAPCTIRGKLYMSGDVIKVTPNLKRRLAARRRIRTL